MGVLIFAGVDKEQPNPHLLYDPCVLVINYNACHL